MHELGHWHISQGASGKKIEWDTLPFEVPAPSDGKVVIDREDEASYGRSGRELKFSMRHDDGSYI